MVRTYKKKGSRRVYPENILDEAKKRVTKGESLRSVAKVLSIETTFLFRYLKKCETAVDLRPPGHKHALSNEIENKLADHLKVMAKNGFALSKTEVLDVVKEYVEQNSLTVPFKDNRPGHDWYIGFCKRHKLSLKKMEPLEKARKINTSDPFLIYEFYDLLEKKIEELDIANKPSHVYNLDETSFCSDPSRVKFVSGIGQKAHRTQEGTGRDNTTVLGCCNAAGVVLPPLIIFQGANLWSSWKGQYDLPGTFYACSEKGWMTSNIFNDFFVKFCQEVKERPLLLIYDGHMTHLDVHTAMYARQNQVTIIKLPAHTTDVLQPLDTTCFKTLKYAWDLKVTEWYRLNQRKMQKNEFVDLLCQVWHNGLTPDNVRKGFSHVGIFPCDHAKYPVSRFDAEKLARYRAFKQTGRSNCDGNQECITAESFENPNTVTESLSLGNVTPCTSTSDKPRDLEVSLSTSDKTMSKPSTSNSESLIGSPVGDGSQSSSSFEMLLLQKINRTLAPKKKRKRVDASSKVITSDEWIAAEQLKKDQENDKLKTKELKCLGKLNKGEKTAKKSNANKKIRPKNKQNLLSSIPLGNGNPLTSNAESKKTNAESLDEISSGRPTVITQTDNQLYLKMENSSRPMKKKQRKAGHIKIEIDEDTSDSDEPSLCDTDEESLSDLISNSKKDIINPVAYEAPVFSGKYKERDFCFS
ncbi:uncharacterized protein LOC124370837 [Homalodisca vitripennis]|uniref:uncharacterized protein LOC124370837 n=1 Tax=Homalodisca vitripennis TaxID=197043 RepID=UPI001EEAFC6E|nr:uncharacterized protein LOC124370837 [Homalodisca vitripennis]